MALQTGGSKVALFTGDGDSCEVRQTAQERLNVQTVFRLVFIQEWGLVFPPFVSLPHTPSSPGEQFAGGKIGDTPPKVRVGVSLRVSDRLAQVVPGKDFRGVPSLEQG